MANHLPVVALSLFLLITTRFCDGRREEDESSAAVVKGSVFCDTCSQHSLHSPTTYFIPGAAVAVECSINRKARASIRVEGRTDQSGEFKIVLPSFGHNTYSGCSVELINSPDGSCSVPSVGKLAFTLKEHRGGVHCAGPLSYRPLLAPSSCFVEEEESEQRISYVRGREALESHQISKQTVSPPSITSFIPPLPSFPTFSVPPLPKLSVPPLPSIPTLSVPPLSNVPTVKVPPLASIPPLPKFNAPPIPFNIPPLPFFTPPPPSK